MKIVFFGTPTYCLPILNKIQKVFKVKLHDVPIVAVVTQKPKPVGRKEFITYSAVDTWAFKRQIPVFYSVEDFFKKKVDADLGVVVAYGEILPKEIINYFPNGILNVHPSLLPKFRGASPLQSVIASGDLVTGATIMKIDEKMDHGPIVSQFTEEILENDNSKILGDRIFERAAQVLVDLIPAYIKGKISLKNQNDKNATYTTLLKKEHGFIPPKYLEGAVEGKTSKEDWNIEFMKDFSLRPSPENIERFVRAVSPWPGAWTYVFIDSKKKEQKRFKILEAQFIEGKLVPKTVKLEGKLEVTWKEFKKGYPNFSFS
jgi:methionyl-tRNA formyltransferase